MKTKRTYIKPRVLFEEVRTENELQAGTTVLEGNNQESIENPEDVW